MALPTLPAPSRLTSILVLGAGAAAVVAPLAYAACLKAAFGRRCVVETTRTEGELVPEEEKEEEEEDGDECRLVGGGPGRHRGWVVVRERVVSEPVVLSGPRGEKGEQQQQQQEEEEGEEEEEETYEESSALVKAALDVYLRTSMRLFLHTPQAWLMRRMVEAIPDPQAAATFEDRYLRACMFEAGDRVCGVYVVRRRSGTRASKTLGERDEHEEGRGGGRRLARGPERGDEKGVDGVDGVEERIGALEVASLDLSPPGGWTGPVVKGKLVVAIEEVPGGEPGVVGAEGKARRVRIINETVLWRRRDDKTVFLEGAVGRWLHGLMVQWMVVRGMDALVEWDAGQSS